MKKLISVFIAIITFCLLPRVSTKKLKLQQKVLLIGLDGFQWDFVQMHQQQLTNFLQLQKKGVRAGYVRNVFPTNTFPNFYSVVTGLYPEHHGIIDNQMYDMMTKDKFSMKSTATKWWNEAEPIWVTNQAQGFKSGLCYWPGYNVKIKGRFPSYVQGKEKINPALEGKPMSHQGRIDLGLKWLKQHDVTFAAIYFEDIDDQIHGSGDRNIETAMKSLDSMFGYLQKQLGSLPIRNSINVMVIGDHGGKNINQNKVIRLNDYIDIRSHAVAGIGNTFVSIYPKPGHLDKIYLTLKTAHPHMKVYRKKDLPYHMHIKHKRRTAPLMLLADPGWIIDSDFEDLGFPTGKEFHKGDHGYSNFNRAMNPGFFAFGPCFKKGLKIGNIRTIDLYPIMCQIIGLNPKKSDGSLAKVKRILTSKCLK